MSFILKALKKVDQEKTVKKEGTVDLHTALLTDTDSKKETSPWIVRGAALVLVLIVAGALTWKFMKPGKTSKRAASRAARISRISPAPEVPQASAVPAPAPAPVQAPSSAPVPLPVAAPVPAPAAAPAQVTARSAAAPGPQISADTPRKTRHASAGKQPPARAPRELTGTAPADLKVNGIAYQDEPADSMAVVNGVLVKRGMTVGGMKVDEIFRDRVRFSGRDGLFDLQLSRLIILQTTI